MTTSALRRPLQPSSACARDTPQLLLGPLRPKESGREKEYLGLFRHPRQHVQSVRRAFRDPVRQHLVQKDGQRLFAFDLLDHGQPKRKVDLLDLVAASESPAPARWPAGGASGLHAHRRKQLCESAGAPRVARSAVRLPLSRASDSRPHGGAKRRRPIGGTPRTTDGRGAPRGAAVAALRLDWQ